MFSNQLLYFSRVLFPTLATVAIMVAATLFVKFGSSSKWSVSTHAGKFQNPFKNLNLIIAMVILGFILLHILTFYIEIPEDLLFPKMPCGFDMVAMCAMFTIFNSDAKEHMLRKCPVLRGHLEVVFCNKKKRVQPMPAHSDGNSMGQAEGVEGKSADFKAGSLFTVARLNQTNNKNFGRKEFRTRPPHSDERARRNMNRGVLTVENLEDQ